MNGNREFHLVFQLGLTQLATGERQYTLHTGSATLEPGEVFDAAMIKKAQAHLLENILRDNPEGAVTKPTVRLLSWQQLESAEGRP